MRDAVIITTSDSASASLHVAQMCQRTPHLNAVIKRFMPRDATASVLDLGAGFGAFIHAARAMGYHNIEGCDLAVERIDAATALGIDAIIHGDLFDVLARQADASRDVVVSFDILEHLTKEQVIDCAGQVLRVLGPTGRWLIHTVNGESPFFGRIRYGDFTHQLVFTRRSLLEVLTNRGFSRVDFYEDAPVVHGAASAVRWFLWRAICAASRFRVAVETGSFDRAAIYTQNLFAVAFK